MNITFHKYKISDLKEKQITQKLLAHSHIPVSPLRINSYLNNPACSADDYILFLAIHQNDCIGFRTVLPDNINGKYGVFKAAWLSGNWVHPQYRRKGISLELLNLVLKEWDENILFTNYSPSSEQVYLKSCMFSPFINTVGERIYLLPPLRKVLLNRNLRSLAKIASIFDYILYSIKLFRQIKPIKPSLFVHKTECTSNRILESLSSNIKGSLSCRGKKEYDWIHSFPWLEKGLPDLSYPFSWKYLDYKEITYYYQENDNTPLSGVLIARFKNGTITTPFFFYNTEEVGLDLLKTLFIDAQNAKIVYCTFFNKEIITMIKKIKVKFLGKKKIYQKYYLSCNLNKKMKNPNCYKIQDGEGDVAFV